VKTIFVVDDDQEQAELMAQALTSRTCRVRAFSDPIRALAALASDGTDLLIADLAMPWIDGGDMVASARVKRPGLKIFLVSGFAHGADIARLHNVPFFLKPVDLSALRAAAADALSRV
jgi:DNA-binding NtrC family response regulator